MTRGVNTKVLGRREFSKLYATQTDDGLAWVFVHDSRVIECGANYLEAMRFRGRAVRNRIQEIRLARKPPKGA